MSRWSGVSYATYMSATSRACRAREIWRTTRQTDNEQHYLSWLPAVQSGSNARTSDCNVIVISPHILVVKMYNFVYFVKCLCVQVRQTAASFKFPYSKFPELFFGTNLFDVASWTVAESIASYKLMWNLLKLVWLVEFSWIKYWLQRRRQWT